MTLKPIIIRGDQDFGMSFDMSDEDDIIMMAGMPDEMKEFFKDSGIVLQSSMKPAVEEKKEVEDYLFDDDEVIGG